MLTAAESAPILGVSARKVYSLAKSGDLTSYRIGRSLRIDPADLDAYKKSCRLVSTKETSAGATTLTASLKANGSALAAYFQKAGLAPKRIPMTRAKTASSTPLQLVSPSPRT